MCTYYWNSPMKMLLVASLLFFPSQLLFSQNGINARDPRTQRIERQAGIHEQSLLVDLRGIRVGCNGIVRENPTSLDAALRVPGVDGLVLNIGWDELEPAMGGYKWDTLDLWINRADSLGKQITLSVAAGLRTPSWLFQPRPNGGGAVQLSFSIGRKGGNTGVCEPDTIAAPWDPAFVAQWDSMLVHVAAHLKKIGRYGTVTILRLTGINRDTDELHLPAEMPGPMKDSCLSNSVATWQLAGYRPSLLLQGWDSVTNCFKRNFPDKFFSVAIIASTHPFPSIDENDSIFNVTNSESLSVAQNQPLLMLASKKFPGHLIIQNNSLYVTIPAQPQTIHAAQSLGTLLAFQTNEDLPPANDKRASCGGPGDTTVCSAATYLEELETGIYPLGKDSSLRAQYIEVFAANVNAFPLDILQAHNELVGSNQTGVSTINPNIPATFELQQNYPNPFNPATIIHYQLSADVFVTLKVYDVLGREIRQLVHERQKAGSYSVTFNGDNVPSGIYFYSLQAGTYSNTKKLVLLK